MSDKEWMERQNRIVSGLDTLEDRANMTLADHMIADHYQKNISSESSSNLGSSYARIKPKELLIISIKVSILFALVASIYLIRTPFDQGGRYFSRDFFTTAKTVLTRPYCVLRGSFSSGLDVDNSPICTDYYDHHPNEFAPPEKTIDHIAQEKIEKSFSVFAGSHTLFESTALKAYINDVAEKGGYYTATLEKDYGYTKSTKIIPKGTMVIVSDIHPVFPNGKISKLRYAAIVSCMFAQNSENITDAAKGKCALPVRPRDVTKLRDITPEMVDNVLETQVSLSGIDTMINAVRSLVHRFAD